MSITSGIKNSENTDNNIMSCVYISFLGTNRGLKKAGKVIFFDAFPQKDVSIKPDIMNPHYPKYYSGDESPTDWQNPTPIKFLTVENTSFNLVLVLNKKETDKNRHKIDSNPGHPSFSRKNS